MSKYCFTFTLSSPVKGEEERGYIKQGGRKILLSLRAGIKENRLLCIINLLKARGFGLLGAGLNPLIENAL